MLAHLQALHKKDIVHRDIKPQNILLTADLRAKVSDMGLSKQIAPSQTSFDSYGGGSSGWLAPELIVNSKNEGKMRQSKAVDIFSLALVLFWTLTHGKHAYGEHVFERDGNIVNGEPDLSLLDGLPDMQNLLRAMLHRCACSFTYCGRLYSDLCPRFGDFRYLLVSCCSAAHSCKAHPGQGNCQSH
jgi:serine/threonine-protein kinase/endoribonuclease IRE1